MGEPLTHPLLPRWITLARERGFRSVLTTNGTLLGRRGAEILAARPHKVSISVHCLESGDPDGEDAYLSTVCEFADQASAAGIIVVLRLWNRGFDGGLNERVFARLKERFPWEWTENTRGVRLRDKLHLEWGDRFAWPDAEAPLGDATVTCYGLNDHFGILCDGRVVPCCLDSEGALSLGNVFEEELSEILSSSRAEAIREGFASHRAAEELCRRCGYARRFR